MSVNPRRRFILGIAYNRLVRNGEENNEKHNIQCSFEEDGSIINVWGENSTPQSNISDDIKKFVYNHHLIRLHAHKDDLNLAGKPLLYEHKKNANVGKILQSWVDDDKITILGEVNDNKTIDLIDSGKTRGLSVGYTASESFRNGHSRVEKSIEEVSICETPFFRGCTINLLASNKSNNEAPIFLQKNNIKSSNRNLEFVLANPKFVADVILSSSMQEQQQHTHQQSINPTQQSHGNGSTPMEVNHPPSSSSSSSSNGEDTNAQQSSNSGAEKLSLDKLSTEQVTKILLEYNKLKMEKDELVSKNSQLEHTTKEIGQNEYKDFCEVLNGAFGTETVNPDGTVTQTPFLSSKELEPIQEIMINHHVPQNKRTADALKKISFKLRENQQNATSKKRSASTANGTSSSPLIDSYNLKSGVGTDSSKRTRIDDGVNQQERRVAVALSGSSSDHVDQYERDKRNFANDILERMFSNKQ